MPSLPGIHKSRDLGVLSLQARLALDAADRSEIGDVIEMDWRMPAERAGQEGNELRICRKSDVIGGAASSW